MRRKPLVLGAVGALVALAIGGVLLNPKLTTLIEGQAFRDEMDKQTSKGLHFSGQYAPIERTGVLSAKSASFAADGGVKAMKSLKAEGISATFNPLGVFLRRWQLDAIDIETGRVVIQTYEPKPVTKPDKPWYAILLPDRVYLKEVVCKKADILWMFRKKEAGFRGARLVVTPYGRDFAYKATGGTFEMPPFPQLGLDVADLVITKELLTVNALNFQAGKAGTIQLTAQAGMKSDKSIKAEAHFEKVPVGPWIPATWGRQVKGLANGTIHWEGKDQTLEASSATGDLRITAARVAGIPLLDYAASAARQASLKNLDISRCELHVDWKYPRLEFSKIAVEAEGEFAITGTLIVNGGKLEGTLELGTAAKNLEWLPKAKEKIFTRSRDGFLWTTVKLSGTVEEPKDDLTPRVAEALRESPGPSTGLFFRTIGEWFDQTFTGD